MGQMRPARPEESQHSAECIFVARTFSGTTIGPRLGDFSSCWIGVNTLPDVKPGEIWIDEIVNSIPMRVQKRDIQNPSLDEITLSLFNPSAAYETELQFFFNEQYPIPDFLKPFYRMMGLQIYGRKSGGPSFYTVIIPSIEIHRFLMFRSDRLCNAIFHADFGKLIDLKQSFYQKSDDKNSFVRIVSNVNFGRFELQNIAMMLGDDTCRYLRARISGGLHVRGYEARSLFARLFWKEKTRIRVKGFTAPNCSKNGDIFIVQTIEHTTHKPDFDRIEYQYNSTTKNNAPLNLDLTIIGGNGDLRVGGEPPQIDANWPASETPVARRIRLVTSPLDDWNPAVERQDVVTENTQNADFMPLSFPDAFADALSSGTTGSRSSKTGRIRIGMDTSEDAGHPIERLQLLWEVGEEVAANLRGTIRPVTGSQVATASLRVGDILHPLNRIPNYAKNPRYRYFRRSLMLELLIQERYIYVVEVEEVLTSDRFSLALFAKNTFAPMYPAEIDHFYAAAARVRFSWRDSDDASDSRKELRKPLTDFLYEKKLISAKHSSLRTSHSGLLHYIQSKIGDVFLLENQADETPLQ